LSPLNLRDFPHLPQQPVTSQALQISGITTQELEQLPGTQSELFTNTPPTGQPVQMEVSQEGGSLPPEPTPSVSSGKDNITKVSGTSVIAQTKKKNKPEVQQSTRPQRTSRTRDAKHAGSHT
jgi:hypothetical protein